MSDARREKKVFISKAARKGRVWQKTKTQREKEKISKKEN